MVDSTYSFLIFIFVFLPVIILTHEFGHAIVGKLYGKEIKLITLGRGDKLVRIKKFQVNMYFFEGGSCLLKEDYVDNKAVNILFLLGGIIANLITGIILFVLIKSNILGGYVWDEAMELSFVYAIGNLIPYSVWGKNTDGKQIYQQIKYGCSNFNSKYNRNLQELKLLRQSFKLSSLCKYEEALTKVDEVLQINAKFNEAYYQKGHVLDKLKKDNEAFEIYNRILEKEPENIFALSGISIVYFSIGDYDKYFEYSMKAYRLDNRNAATLNNIADYYRLIGDYEKALLYVEKALKIDKDYNIVYSTLSEIYLAKGDKKTFYKYFEKALKLDYKVKGDYEKSYGKVIEEQQYRDLI